MSNTKQIEIIKEALINKFGSIANAKKIAKEKYIEVDKQFQDWKKLGKRKQLYFLPPSMIDTFVRINEADSIYYANNRGPLTGRKGKGFYVRLKTNLGNTIDFKI